MGKLTTATKKKHLYKVKQVIEKIKNDVTHQTFDSVQAGLDHYSNLGQCNAVTITESRIQGINIEEGVISNCHHWFFNNVNIMIGYRSNKLYEVSYLVLITRI